MNYLGIDYGTKKIGLAINFEKIAIPLEIIENKNAIEKIKIIVTERKIEKMVIGMANHVDGRESDHSKKIKSFSGNLKKEVGIDVIFHDERFSSFEAKTSMQNFGIKNFDPKKLDDVAACIILQSYLDSDH